MLIDEDQGQNDPLNVVVVNYGSFCIKIINASVNGVYYPSTSINPLNAVVNNACYEIITLTLKPETLTNGANYLITIVTAKNNIAQATITYNSSSSKPYNPTKDPDLFGYEHTISTPIKIPSPAELWQEAFHNFIMIGTGLEPYLSYLSFSLYPT